MRLTTHLGKVKTNPSNYYILNIKQSQLQPSYYNKIIIKSTY